MKIEGKFIVAATGKVCNKNGEYNPFTKRYKLDSDRLEDFTEYNSVEEIPIPFDTERYGELVNAKIRLKYSESQEFAILRQRDTKSQDYQDYFAYCEKCKTEARAEMEEQSKNGGIE